MGLYVLNWIVDEDLDRRECEEAAEARHWAAIGREIEAQQAAEYEEWCRQQEAKATGENVT